MLATARWLLPSLLLAGLAACATLRAAEEPPERGPGERLMDAAAALDAGDFRTAYPELAWIYSRCPASRVGRDALLLMAASELDPRNDARRPDVGAALAAEYLVLPSAPVEMVPVAETLYLLARELGAAAPSISPPAFPDTVLRLTADCDPRTTTGPARVVRAAADDGDRPQAPQATLLLPDLPVPSVPQRIARVEAQRDSASSQLAALLEQVKELQTRVASQQQEIERIRKTLRP